MKFFFRSWRQDVILKRVLRNSTYLFVGYALGAVLTILTANLLGAADFGILGIITVFTSNVNRLFSFRMSEVVVKYMGEALAHEDKPRAAAVVKAAMLVEALTSIVAFAAVWVLAPFGALLFAHDPVTTPLFQVFGFSILANIINESSTGVLQVTNHYRSQAVINFFQTILLAVLLGLAAYYQTGLTEVLWAYLIGKLILGLGPVPVALYWLPRTLGKDWLRAPFSLLPPWRQMARFAVNTNLNGTINLVARDSESLIIGFFFGPAPAGYYKMALALINMIVQPINPFISTTYPEITRAFVQRQWSKLRSLLQRVTLISAGWTGLVVVGLTVGYPILFQPFYLFGVNVAFLHKYAPAFPALMILLVGYGAANIFFWNRPLLLAQGLADYPVRISAWAMLAKVLLMVLLLPRTNYLVEAALLSGYLLITVSLIVWRGLREINRAEKASALQGEPA